MGGGEVHLPVVGSVHKKALMIGGGAAAGLILLIYVRKKKAGTAPPSSTDPNAADPNAGAYVDPGLQDTGMGPTYGATGYYDPNSGQWVYGNSGTGQALATTNAQWAQNAVSYLSGSGVDTGALSSALGAYLAGQSLTSDQVSLVDQAIAVEGYPPVAGAGGYPPGIRESGTPSQGDTGGSGGGVTGSGSGSGSGSGDGSSAGTGVTGTGTGAARAGAISNLHVTGYNRTGVSFAWNPAPGATQGYAWQLTGNGISKRGSTSATHVSVTGLKKGVYNFGVQGLPGGPGNNIHTPSLKG